MRDSKIARRAVMGIVAGVAGLGLLFGASAAYWTGGGAGTGTVVTSTAPAPMVITQTADVGHLAPGSEVALAGVITNPNNVGIQAGTLTAEITGVSNGANLGDFTLKFPNNSPVVINQMVPGLNGTLPWSGIMLRYHSTALNQDGGKGVTVTITYTLT
jgi:hypothetical protein